MNPKNGGIKPLIYQIAFYKRRIFVTDIVLDFILFIMLSHNQSVFLEMLFRKTLHII